MTKVIELNFIGNGITFPRNVLYMKHEEAVTITIQWNFELQFVKSFTFWCEN